MGSYGHRGFGNRNNAYGGGFGHGAGSGGGLRTECIYCQKWVSDSDIHLTECSVYLSFMAPVPKKIQKIQKERQNRYGNR
eukprot:UN12537